VKLSEIVERPIAAGERLTAFLIVSTLLLVTAAALIVLPEPENEISSVASTGDPGPTRSVVGPEPGWETAAREFLDGYLRFSYGRARADALVRVAPRLRSTLAKSRHRVSPAARGRSPEVESIEAEEIRPGNVSALATVEEEGIEFPIEVTLASTDGRWLVVEIGEGH
jgi:hypothetical protein